MLYKFETDSAYYANVNSQPEKLSFTWDWEVDGTTGIGKGTPKSFKWWHTENTEFFRYLDPRDAPGQIEGVISSLGISGEEQVGLDFIIKVLTPERIGKLNNPDNTEIINPEIMKGNMQINQTSPGAVITLASNFTGSVSAWLVAYGTVTQFEEE